MPEKVDQSRVNMTLLAIRCGYWVTQGACQEVPISGLGGGHLTGQVTCRHSLSGGAAKSEPHRPPATTARQHRRACDRVGTGAGWRGVPVVQGGRVDLGDAHPTGVDECIYGVMWP